MKKLSLFVVVLFASLSMFANVKPVVKVEYSKPIVQKFKEFIKEKMLLSENDNNSKQKLNIDKEAYNTIYFFIVGTHLATNSEIFYCDGYLLNYFIEVTEVWKRELSTIEVDENNVIVFEAILGSWLEWIHYTEGECPELGGYI